VTFCLSEVIGFLSRLTLPESSEFMEEKDPLAIVCRLHPAQKTTESQADNSRDNNHLY
jgi:hypothetical protein